MKWLSLPSHIPDGGGDYVNPHAMVTIAIKHMVLDLDVTLAELWETDRRRFFFVLGWQEHLISLL